MRKIYRYEDFQNLTTEQVKEYLEKEIAGLKFVEIMKNDDNEIIIVYLYKHEYNKIVALKKDFIGAVFFNESFNYVWDSINDEDLSEPYDLGLALLSNGEFEFSIKNLLKSYESKNLEETSNHLARLSAIMYTLTLVNAYNMKEGKINVKNQ